MSNSNSGNWFVFCLFTLLGLIFLLGAPLGWKIIPYKRWGIETALEKWQMGGIGTVSLAIALFGAIGISRVNAEKKRDN